MFQTQFVRSRLNNLIEAVLTRTINLCFQGKFEKQYLHLPMSLKKKCNVNVCWGVNNMGC